jgi:hypothetical protein
MASLGRVPNAEMIDGNFVDVSAVIARAASRDAGRGNGQTTSFHRSPLRAGRRRREIGSACKRAPRQIAAAHLSTLKPLIAAVFAATLSACAPLTQGDFERPRPSVFNDDFLPIVGSVAAGVRDEPRSDFEYTDAERQLRSRSWALLMPQQQDQHFQRWLAEMRRTRMISVEKTVPSRSDYVKELLSQNYRSSGARFARLEMDIRNDRVRFPPFITIANTVAEYDRVRERSMNRTADLTPEERENALGRIEENKLLIWTVQKSMRERAGIYRYALERLVIETPDDAAIGAEHELLALETDLGALGPPPGQFAVTGK